MTNPPPLICTNLPFNTCFSPTLLPSWHPSPSYWELSWSSDHNKLLLVNISDDQPSPAYRHKSTPKYLLFTNFSSLMTSLSILLGVSYVIHKLSFKSYQLYPLSWSSDHSKLLIINILYDQPSYYLRLPTQIYTSILILTNPFMI